MRDVNGRTIQPGHRVVLVSNRYGQSKGNPRQGSPYECEGTVVAGTAVEWDNGVFNTYSDGTLKIVSGCISIWES